MPVFFEIGSAQVRNSSDVRVCLDVSTAGAATPLGGGTSDGIGFRIDELSAWTCDTNQPIATITNANTAKTAMRVRADFITQNTDSDSVR